MNIVVEKDVSCLVALVTRLYNDLWFFCERLEPTMQHYFAAPKGFIISMLLHPRWPPCSFPRAHVFYIIVKRFHAPLGVSLPL